MLIPGLVGLLLVRLILSLRGQVQYPTRRSSGLLLFLLCCLDYCCTHLLETCFRIQDQLVSRLLKAGCTIAKLQDLIPLEFHSRKVVKVRFLMSSKEFRKVLEDLEETPSNCVLQLQPCLFDGSFEGSSFFHFLADLDPSHPTVPRLLKRLANAGVQPSMLEGFTAMQPSNREMHSPLTFAVFYENLPVAEWLLTLGADPNCNLTEYDVPSPILIRSSWPIVHAAMMKDDSLVKLLLKRGAKHVERQTLNEADGITEPETWGGNEAMTPLHLAAYNCRFENVRILVLHGADLERRCNLRGSRDWGEPEPAPEPRVARDAVEKGIRERNEGRNLPSAEHVISCALGNFDAAAQAALEDRRLLVLGCFRRAFGSIVPDHLLERIFELAGLYYPT